MARRATAEVLADLERWAVMVDTSLQELQTAIKANAQTLAVLNESVGETGQSYTAQKPPCDTRITQCGSQGIVKRFLDLSIEDDRAVTEEAQCHHQGMKKLTMLLYENKSGWLEKAHVHLRLLPLKSGVWEATARTKQQCAAEEHALELVDKELAPWPLRRPDVSRRPRRRPCLKLSPKEKMRVRPFSRILRSRLLPRSPLPLRRSGGHATWQATHHCSQSRCNVHGLGARDREAPPLACYCRSRQGRHRDALRQFSHHVPPEPPSNRPGQDADG